MIRQTIFLAILFLCFVSLDSGQPQSKPKSPRGSYGKLEKRRSSRNKSKNYTAQLCSLDTYNFLSDLHSSHNDDPVAKASYNIVSTYGIDLQSDDLVHSLHYYKNLALALAQSQNLQELYTFLGFYYKDSQRACTVLSQSVINGHIEQVRSSIIQNATLDDRSEISKQLSSIFNQRN